MRIAVISGPNLNLLGKREPELYGRETLEQIGERLKGLASDLGVDLDLHQSNAEGDLIAYIHAASGRVDGFLVNAGGLTHTSVSLRDALVGVGFGAESYVLGLRGLVARLTAADPPRGS